MEGFSFRWYVKLAQNQTILGAFKNSLILGALTSIVVTGIGIPLQWPLYATIFRLRILSTPCC